MDIAKTLKNLGACADAIDWAFLQPDPQTAWEACERPDWMFWLCGKLKIDQKLMVLAACEIAEGALAAHLKSADQRPAKCIEVTRAWCRGEASIDDVLIARRAAASGAYAAYAAADAYAAYTAAAAAYAAADAAAAAAAYAYAADARLLSKKQSAAIIRKHISFAVIDAALKA